MTSLQSKISMFNKPNVNAVEEMKVQKAKAKFRSKLSKFENINAPVEDKPSKAEVFKKAKIFEQGEVDEVDLKEKEIRKQSFNLIKQQFQTKTEIDSQDKETLLESDSSGFGSIEDISTTKGSTDSTTETSSTKESDPTPEISTTHNQDNQLEDLVDRTTEVQINSQD